MSFLILAFTREVDRDRRQHERNYRRGVRGWGIIAEAASQEGKGKHEQKAE